MAQRLGAVQSDVNRGMTRGRDWFASQLRGFERASNAGPTSADLALLSRAGDERALRMATQIASAWSTLMGSLRSRGKIGVQALPPGGAFNFPLFEGREAEDPPPSSTDEPIPLFDPVEQAAAEEGRLQEYLEERDGEPASAPSRLGTHLAWGFGLALVGIGTAYLVFGR